MDLQQLVVVGWIFAQRARRDDELLLPLRGLRRLLLSLLVAKDRQSLLLEKQYVVVSLRRVSQQQLQWLLGRRLIAAALVPDSMRDLLAGVLLVPPAALCLLPQRRRVTALPLLLEVLFEHLPHHGADDLVRDLLKFVNVLVLLLIVDRREALVASIVEAPVRQLHSEPLLKDVPVHDGIPRQLLLNLALQPDGLSFLGWLVAGG